MNLQHYIIMRNRISTILSSVLLSLAAVAPIVSCTSSKDEEMAEEAVKNFAENYFGCKYSEAAEQCTPESRRWIEFVATNVSDSDLQVLNNSLDETSFEVKDMTVGDDSTANCVVEAHNYLRLSSIEDKGQIAPSDSYSLKLVHKGGRWLVALDGVLKPEKTGDRQ